jgi:uncharacterized membrane protein
MQLLDETVILHEKPLVKSRIHSVDILRGAVMIIMALDHTRDFFHITGMTQDPTDLSTTTPALFFTRWITHYCAPIFLFLSGVSAFLSGQKKSKEELSLFLIKRGFWLIVVEVLIVTLGITFNPFYNFVILQVIWAIGWSMVILGVLVRTNKTVILIIGLVIFLGHNVFDYLTIPKEGAGSVLINLFITSPRTFYPVSENRIIADIYAILPWTSIMLLGFSFGNFYRPGISFEKRQKIFFFIGFSAILLFIVLRVGNIYGDIAHWKQQRNTIFTVLSFVNVTKYPPSLLYSLMTLGPGIIILALTEKSQGAFANFLKVYGRVPFFYYVCHFYLIHTLCLVAFFLTGRGTNEIVEPNSPFYFRPNNFGFDLWIVYLVWISVILALYLPCKWFNTYKMEHRQWWLSYV